MYLRTVFRSCPEILEIAEMFFPSRSRSCITHHPSMFSKVRPPVFRRGPMLLVHVGNFRPPFLRNFGPRPTMAVRSASSPAEVSGIHIFTSYAFIATQRVHWKGRSPYSEFSIIIISQCLLFRNNILQCLLEFQYFHCFYLNSSSHRVWIEAPNHQITIIKFFKCPIFC